MKNRLFDGIIFVLLCIATGIFLGVSMRGGI